MQLRTSHHSLALLLAFALPTSCAPAGSTGDELGQTFETSHADLNPVWSCVNVGAPSSLPPCQVTVSDGVFAVSSSGQSGWAMDGDQEQMRFIYTQVSHDPATGKGDVELIVRLKTASFGSNEAQFGVMIRSGDPAVSSELGAAGFVAVNDCGPPAGCRTAPFHGYNMAMRTAAGANSFKWESAPPLALAMANGFPDGTWLRLQRLGNDFAVSRSRDGERWVTLANVAGGAFPATNADYIGFYVSSGAGTDPVSASFDNVILREGMGNGPDHVRRVHATSWVGATYAANSTGHAIRQFRGMYVAPSGKVFTLAAEAEEGGNIAIFDSNAAPGQQITNLGSQYHTRSLDQGGITGDATHLYLVARDAPEGPAIVRLDQTTLQRVGSDSVPLGSNPQIGGMVVSNGKLFVSDVAAGEIRAYDLSNLSLPALGTAEFVGVEPGPITADAGGHLWIVETAVDYPILGNYDVQRAASVRRYSSQPLAYTGTQITGLLNPSAIAYRSAGDQLLIAENGIGRVNGTVTGQNVLVYANVSTAPVAAAPFSPPGGVYSGTPGLFFDAASGGHRRFHAPTALGVDQAGNVYVNSGSSPDVRKFDGASGAMTFRVEGSVNSDGGALESGPAGDHFFTMTKHYTLDLSNPNAEPGAEATLRAVTWNPLDSQGTPSEFPPGARPEVRWVNGERFLFANRASGLIMYRFSGEMMVPYATLQGDDHDLVPETPPVAMRLWVDAGSLNGQEDAGEVRPILTAPGLPSTGGFAVTPQGDIWMLAHPSVWLLKNAVSCSAAPCPKPAYDLGSGFEQRSLGELPEMSNFETTFQLRYVDNGTSQLMYIVGIHASETLSLTLQDPVTNELRGVYHKLHSVIRFANWTTESWSSSPPQLQAIGGKEYVTGSDQLTHYTEPTPGAADFVQRKTLYLDGNEIKVDGDSQNTYKAVDVAGDKIFFAEHFGPVRVVDANTGVEEAILFAGPEASGTQLWNDGMSLSAVRRPNGEYLVALADVSNRPRALLFRYTPGAPSAACSPNDSFGSMAPALSGSVNADGLALSTNGLTAYVSRKTPSGQYDIYSASRASVNDAFSLLAAVAGDVNTGADERGPFLAGDGRLYFTRGSGSNAELAAAQLGVNGFTTQLLTSVNSSEADQHAFLLPGEQTMFLASDRQTPDDLDLYASTRVNGTFDAPAALLSVNSAGDDAHPVLSPDGLTLYFGSRRPGALSSDTDGDIYVAQRGSLGESFAVPAPLSTLNTSGAEFPVAISADGCTLYLASNREEGFGGIETYRLYAARRQASPSQVTVTLHIVGNGSVAESPYDCTPNGGTCTAQRPFGDVLVIDASRQALWSGVCGPNGSPGLSTDGVIPFAVSGTCTVTFQ